MALSTSKKAAVIVKSQFIQPLDSGRRFNDYLNYLDREGIKRQPHFGSYTDYMADDTKTTSLFTDGKDDLSKKDKEKVKQAFKDSQKKGSLMWQDVISFDNHWLQKNGMYDPKTHTVDETKLKDITRMAMKDMVDNHNIHDNCIWTGSIHYNTDNIHIHLATVEYNPTNERGKRKLSTLDHMKSIYVNKIMDRTKQHKKINDLVRSSIVNDKKRNKDAITSDSTFQKDFLRIYKQLPPNKRYWSYGYQNINHLKPQLDELTMNYINKHYKKEWKELHRRLDEETAVIKQTYGTGQDSKYKNYKKNKIHDLYHRMGNVFLKEMKEYDLHVDAINRKHSDKSKHFRQAKKGMKLNQMKYGIDRLVYSELKTNKNQAAYQQHVRNQERGPSL